MANNAASITAAGAVLWRPSRKHGVKVALVHRPRYDDWSFPKGKAAKGESVLQTAAREVREETGFAVRLGRHLTTVTYPVSSGNKAVHYFTASVADGSFRDNREVDRLAWMPVHKARKHLTYHYDRTVLDEFATLPADLSTVVLVRHARAGQRDDFGGADDERPLDGKGMAQAAVLAKQLRVFGPARIAAAPLVRCEQTVRRLADSLRMTVDIEDALSEQAYQQDPARARRRVTELALQDVGDGPVVVCSQGGVIPGVVKSLAARTNLALPTVATPKAAYWVLSFETKRLRQADRYLLPEL